MTGIQELVGAVLRRWCPSVSAARRILAEAWFEPDPVALAVPLADLAPCSAHCAAAGLRIAVATTDDRRPTEATLAGLGVAVDIVARPVRRRRRPDQAGAGRPRRARRGAGRDDRADRDGRRHAGRPADGPRGRRARDRGRERGDDGGRPRAPRGRRPGLDRRSGAACGGPDASRLTRAVLRLRISAGLIQSVQPRPGAPPGDPNHPRRRWRRVTREARRRSRPCQARLDQRR